MLSTYWGLLFLSLHLGFHWNRMMGMAARIFGPTSRPRRMILRILGAGIALYGVYAFLSRQIPTYMFLQSQFVFFISRNRFSFSFSITVQSWDYLSG